MARCPMLRVVRLLFLQLYLLKLYVGYQIINAVFDIIVLAVALMKDVSFSCHSAARGAENKDKYSFNIRLTDFTVCNCKDR